MEINLKQRVEWLAARIELNGQEKDLITFQLKNIAYEAVEKYKEEQEKENK